MSHDQAGLGWGPVEGVEISTGEWGPTLLSQQPTLAAEAVPGYHIPTLETSFQTLSHLQGLGNPNLEATTTTVHCLKLFLCYKNFQKFPAPLDSNLPFATSSYFQRAEKNDVGQDSTDFRRERRYWVGVCQRDSK